MDKLDRYQEELERRREAIASTAAVSSAALADRDKPRTDMPETDYPVTIIGCIRGVDGWYEAGYDQRKRSIIPMQMIQRRSIFSGDDCPMCANSDRKTNTCTRLTIDGGTPCRYYHPRPELENHERALQAAGASACTSEDKSSTEVVRSASLADDEDDPLEGEDFEEDQ